MASREERAKLRAQHQAKLDQMAKQPENHATFDTEIPTPKVDTITVLPEEPKVEKADTPTKPKVETKVTNKKKTETVDQKAKKKAEIKKTREEWYASKVKALENYKDDDKRSVKIIGKHEDITFWLKQSRKKGIAQQDYLALILLETIEAVRNGEINDESEEVLEYQKVLRDMDTPVNSRLPYTLVEEIKDAASELCMKQTGFYAYSLKRARLAEEK